MEEDTFLTILSPAEGIFKDKGSKFFSYAYPVKSEEEVKSHIDQLKKEHHSARHHCYAYILGHKKDIYRANDDGEPSNSAGKPILGQIQSKNVTNILIVVVRYFGGTLLGVGGLIQAYKESACNALENAEFVEVIVKDRIHISFTYNDLNNVMRIVKEEDLEIESSKMELSCEYVLLCRKSRTHWVAERLTSYLNIKVKTLDS